MGQQYSQPKNGAEIKVIGAGLPRTGTASFSKALEILLDGPVYHGGTQVTLGPEVEIKSWIKILSQFTPTNAPVKGSNLDLIKQRTEGFVAITDSPGSGLVPELIELYPDAKVICTIRDVDSWVESMGGIASASTQWFLRFVLFPVPAMRFFVTYIDRLRNQWLYLYGEAEPPTSQSYNRHMEYLKKHVPPEKLIFLDVKDGWEPLCKALDMPVPEVPFPRINDGKAIEDFAKWQIGRGLKRWGVILAVTVAAMGIGKTFL